MSNRWRSWTLAFVFVFSICFLAGFYFDAPHHLLNPDPNCPICKVVNSSGINVLPQPAPSPQVAIISFLKELHQILDSGYEFYVYTIRSPPADI